MGISIQQWCVELFVLLQHIFHVGTDIIPESLTSYNDEDQGKFKTILKFDCRGMEPSDFSPRVGHFNPLSAYISRWYSFKFSFFQNGWLVDGLESGTKFSDIDLSDKEWADYDEKAKTTVGIYEIEHKFAREK